MSDRAKVYQIRKKWMTAHNSYSFRYYKYFDFKLLSHIMKLYQSGKSHVSFNDAIIMLDTETSKEVPGTNCKNYVVAWTISIRAYEQNIVTLYGSRPSECIHTLNQMIMNMPGDKTVIYVHNLSYDWVFLRKYLLAEYGTPLHQLNTNSHFPLFIEFSSGLIFRDSLSLAQRSLEKWAKDLDVPHQKAVGYWDYDAKRNQDARFTPEEKTYIEHDTLAGVECIEKTMKELHKSIYSIPYTATGIPREAVRKLAKENWFREKFLRIVPPYETQMKLERVFHGGYTHNNRHYIGVVTYGVTTAKDFASSYPYCMMAEKFPMERFAKFRNCSVDFILRNSEKYAYIFKLILIKPRLKTDNTAMPALQKSKGVKMVDPVEDNGRILCAGYFEIWLNEIDLGVIAQQYEWDAAYCIEVEFSRKDYLPKWFTDYVYKCFKDKTQLKGGDPVAYNIAKGKLNSLYGMCVQKPIKQVIEEDYLTGEFGIKDGEDPKEIYDKYVHNRNSVLPYQWGVWTTSYAYKHLFELGSCAGLWLYSDTDSCYGQDWNEEALEAYNENCRKILTARGYPGVEHNGRIYWPGVAETDGVYQEFVSVGAKRYAVRDMKGKVKTVVAGVPRKGFQCLKDDLHNFKAGLIFDGETTGKKLHTYYFEDDTWIDADGNERGDSIDLSPNDYLLDSVHEVDWEKIFMEDIYIKTYEENVL